MAGNVIVSSLDAARSACPKRMHNGPCGGVQPDGMCEADAALPCPYLPLYDVLPWRIRAPLELRPHAPRVRSALADKLSAGGFAVIAEAYPPDGVDASAIVEQYRALGKCIDGVNVPDNPLATPHLGALGLAALMQRSGVPAILNFSCRDRNRIGLQSDLLAAAALGIENVLCVTGDHTSMGDHSHAHPVFDLDSMGLLKLVRRLRDEGRFDNDQPLDSAPTYLIGGVGNPSSMPAEWQAERTAAKVVAGADFLQTHPVPDLNVFRSFMRRLTDLGALERAWLIAGVVVVTTLEQALWLQTEMPTPLVHDELITLLHQTRPEYRRAEALAYAADMIAELRMISGVSGVLLFPMGHDLKSVADLAEVAELKS